MQAYGTINERIPDCEPAADIYDIYRVRVPLEVEVARILAGEHASIPAAHAAVANLSKRGPHLRRADRASA